MDEKKLNMLVQKSHPLLSLCQSTDMTLPEFKILDIYLAHINSHDIETRDLVLAQGEMEELLEVKRILPEDLRKRLNHLLGTVYVKGDVKSSSDVEQYTLFSIAYSHKEKNGKWYVRLRCTEEAIKYVFNIEDLGYVKYRIRKIVSLKSRYSYCLYMYLLHHTFRKTWFVDLNSLKEMYCCQGIPFYDEFKYFNREILKPSTEELKKNRCLDFDYKIIKDWRTVTGVEFTVHSLLDEKIPSTEPVELGQTLKKAAETAENETEWPEYPDPEWDDHERDLNLFAAACSNEFNHAEMENIWAILSPHQTWGRFRDSIEIYHYLEQAYTRMNTIDGIDNRFSYFTVMIKNDLGTP